MIERIKIQNFKSLVDVDVELRPLNVLIGRNGSGKSNFLAFLRLLREGADEELSRIIREMGGIDNVSNYNIERGAFFWQVIFEFLMYRYDYSGRIFKDRPNRYLVMSEDLTGTSTNLVNPDFSYSFSFGNSLLREFDAMRSPVETRIESNDQELIISQIRDKNRYSHLFRLRLFMMDWQIYHGLGEQSLRNIRAPQLFNVVDPLRLDPSGNNLISILQHIANDPRYEAVYERLNEVMLVVFPDFKRFDMPISAGGTGSLAYRSQDYPATMIPALNMSDGMLRFLGLMLLLLLTHGPNPPSLIAIDEPEIGMHPKMLEIFAQLLKEASQKTQIIVTTHSPNLLDFMSPEDVILVEKRDGRTTMERPDAVKLKDWLEDFTLGKLWTMGAIRR